MIGFASPGLLAPGLLIAGAVVAAMLTRRHRQLAALRLLTSVEASPAPRIATCAVTLGLLLAAIGGPHWGYHEEPLFQAAGDVWLCVDVSRSMTTPDVSPNRLERAKELLGSLADSLTSRRVGLIAFAGDAQIVCPPTRDGEFLRSTIAELSIDSAPAGGSDLSAPFRLLAKRQGESPHPAIALLVSDGGHETERAADAAELANSAGLVVFTLGIGDPEIATPIPADMGAGPMVERGQIVRSRLNEASLREIAERTGGLYLPARTGSADMTAIFLERIEPRAEELVRERYNTVPTPRYRWFVLPSLALALLSFRPAVRRTDRSSRQPG